MKKIIDTISWISFLFFLSAIGTTSIFVGAMVCNYLKDLLGINGWWCLALTPVLFVVAVAVAFFLMLGAKKLEGKQ